MLLLRRSTEAADSGNSDTFGAVACAPLVVLLVDTVVHHVALFLHSGHTRLTHSYLLNRHDQPECSHCDCALTVVNLVGFRNFHYILTSGSAYPLRYSSIVLASIVPATYPHTIYSQHTR